MTRIPWNKGKKMPEETIRRLSESHKGYKMPLSQRIKIGIKIKGRKHTKEAIARMKVAQSDRNEDWRRNIASAKIGKKNPQFGKQSPNWRGGITPRNTAIRNSLEMKAWRLSIFERDNFTCQGCGTRGGKLHAHHVLAFSKFPEHRFSVGNGLTLCPPCHRKTDNYAGKATK